MKIKLFFAALFLLLTKCNAYSQQMQTLHIPTGWTAEKFALPPAFAANMPFKGNEEVAFSPVWGKKKAEGYWTYCYIWKLEGKPQLNKLKIEDALRLYYSRLVVTNLALANIDTAYAIPVNVKLHLLPISRQAVYEGHIVMLDYMTQDPITLNIRVRAINQNLVYFEVSPLPYKNNFWQQMDKICTEK